MSFHVDVEVERKKKKKDDLNDMDIRGGVD